MVLLAEYEIGELLAGVKIPLDGGRGDQILAATAADRVRFAVKL